MKDISVVGAWLRALARGHFFTVAAPIGAVSVSERLPIRTKYGGSNMAGQSNSPRAIARATPRPSHRHCAIRR